MQICAPAEGKISAQACGSTSERMLAVALIASCQCADYAWLTLRLTRRWTVLARSGSLDSQIDTIVIVGVTAFRIRQAEYFLRCGHSMSVILRAPLKTYSVMTLT